jgi:TPR repeat protein
MPCGAPLRGAADSQSCERVLRSGAPGRVVAACAAIALAAAAVAAPDEDYRRGERAYRSGDVVEAVAVLRRAAENGHAPSQVLLAEILDRAELNEEAIVWFRRAAEQGDAAGAYGLGAMYLAGEGVKQDPQEAYRWFARAAEKGYAPAILSLASAYLRAARDPAWPAPEQGRAEEWLRRAADLDHLPAAEALAEAYRSGGLGIEPDSGKAGRYAALAEALKKRPAPDKARKKR